MSKMKTLMNFSLENGLGYGVATEMEIQEMCADLDTTIYTQTISSYEDVQEWVCMGGEVAPGYYSTSDGIIEVCGEEEGWEIILIPHLKIVV